MRQRTCFFHLPVSLLLLSPLAFAHGYAQCPSASLSNKVGDTISVTATLFTTDPNENGEGESLTATSSGGELSANVASYNLAAPFSYVATMPNETITGILNGFDGDETCSISATVNPTPGYTPQQKHTANQAALATGLSTITAGVAVSLLCGSGFGTPLCIGLLALSATGGGATATLAYISGDPADPNYKEIAYPSIVSLPLLPSGNGITAQEATAFNELFRVEATINAVGMASATSANRAQGAKNANDSFWENAQLKATDAYNVALGGLLYTDILARNNLYTALKEAGVSATVTPADVLAQEQQLAAVGLPAQEIQGLQLIGLDSSAIQQLTNMLIVQDVDAASGTFPDSLISPTFIAAQQAAAQEFIQGGIKGLL